MTKDTRTPTIHENLESVLHTRSFWLDLRITNAAGTTFTVLLPMWSDDNVEAKEETHVKALVGG